MSLLSLCTIICVERRLMLVHHNTIILQCFVARTVELPRKQTLTRSIETRRVNNDDIILTHNVAHIPQRILRIDGYFRIVQSTCGKRQIFLGSLYYAYIHLNHIDAFHIRILQQFTNNTSITCTEHQNLMRIRMDSHWDVSHHLVIDKLITLCHNDISVCCQYTAILWRFEDVDSVVVVLFRENMLIHLDRQLHILRM